MIEAKKPLKLISFLGVQDYSETTYEWQGLSKTTKFTTVACVEFLQPSELIVFLTTDAEAKNFAALEAELTSVPFKKIIVPLGQDQDELWQIFNTLNDAVADGETIAMDVTNGQRSLPMLALLTAAFMKTARNIDVAHLLYGAFDVGKSIGAGTTPIFDLSEMLNLLDWSVAADRFIRSGDSSDIAERLNNFENRLVNESKNENTSKGIKKKIPDEIIHRIIPFKSISNILVDITNSIKLLRPYRVLMEVDKLNNYIEGISNEERKENQLSPLYQLLDKISHSYSHFANENLRDPERKNQPKLPEDPIMLSKILDQERQLIYWYRDHGYLMQAISLTREWFISWVMFVKGEKKLLDISKRQQYEKYINAFSNPKKDKPTSFDVNFHDQKEFKRIWNQIRDRRNDIAHAGKSETAAEASKLIDKVNILVDEISKFDIPTR